MKTTAFVTLIILTIASVNAKTKTSVLGANDGGSEGHGYTTNAKTSEGVRPFNAVAIHFEGGAGARGGITLDGGAGSSAGGFQQDGHETFENGGGHVGGFHLGVENDGGGASSGGGSHSNGEHGVER